MTGTAGRVSPCTSALNPANSLSTKHSIVRGEAGFTRLFVRTVAQEHSFEGGGPIGLPGARRCHAAVPMRWVGRTSSP
jgi:hypothetical protein